MSEYEHSNILLTDEVRELVALMKDSDIAEVLIERGDAKLHLKRAMPPAPAQIGVPMYSAPAVAAQPIVAAAPAIVAPASTLAEVAEPEQVTGVTITAPMVGTYYGSPSPKEPPYVRIGDEVKPGDVLGIIEAMKIMNEIECEVHGRVARVMVQSAQPVEYGQPLMIIEPL
jgi:acetyl-CoA carboxylase biotin carboxyl carrier protein